ncbi:MAG TPA: TerB N-terminal domain-containing protein, partial [Caldilineaceae bacterium]|nr:TerB N-terminal domain-containing protein [Caldilineaceae bacterium]
MTRLILFRLVFPVLAYIAVVVLAITYIPTDYPNSRDAIALIGLVLIVAGWGLVFARWLHSIRWLKVVAYVLAHLLLSCTIFATILLIGYGFQRVSSVVPAIFSLLSVVLAFSWWLGSLIHLIRHGKRYPYRSIWWRVLLVRAPKETEPTPRTEHAIYGSPSTLPPLHQSSQQMSHAPQTRPYLFQAVSFGRDESPAAGVRIPARDDHPAQAADSRRNKPKSSRPTTERLPLSLEIKVPDPNSGFIKQAHRYASRTQTRSSFVPFQQYWPTYADMTRQQQEWYFYWRTQLRNDQPLPTDTSYLFVHAYELINVIGAPSSQAALDQLVRLWKCYRQEHPKLDSYLVDWIADFLVVHCLSVQPLDWYAQALQVGAYVRRNEDLFLEAWLRNGADIEDLDIDLLYRISDYSPKRSKFYKTHERVFDFDRAFKLGVSAVNSYLRQHHEPGLFQADDVAQRY